MQLFVLNIMLMLAWAAVTASFTEASLLKGFILGWLVLWFTRPLYGNTHYFSKPFQLIRFTLWFVYELFASSVRVAWDILTLESKCKPGIVAIPLTVQTDTQLLLLTSYISLTPGSLSLEITPDKKTLYVHAMFIDDADAVRADIKNGVEKRILDLTK